LEGTRTGLAVFIVYLAAILVGAFVNLERRDA
jgi:hypothetical protein